MKRALVQVALFVFSFSLEVTVHAAEILQEPHDCLKSETACAIENLQEKGYELKVGTATVVLDQGASVIRKSRSEIRLVHGTVWIKGALTVSSEFGSVEGVSDDGKAEFWATKTATEMTALVTHGEANLNPRGSLERLLVEEGLQNDVGEVGFNGIASTGIPMPIPFKDFVLRWGRLFPGPKKEFEAQVDVFRAKWEDASRRSAEINQTLYDRKVASVEDRLRSENEKKAKVEAEEGALRKMFRARMLNGM